MCNRPNNFEEDVEQRLREFYNTACMANATEQERENVFRKDIRPYLEALGKIRNIKFHSLNAKAFDIFRNRIY